MPNDALKEVDTCSAYNKVKEYFNNRRTLHASCIGWNLLWQTAASQCKKMFWSFRDWFCTDIQDNNNNNNNVSSVIVTIINISTVKMTAQSVSDTSQHFYTMTRLSAREDFIEFCRCQNFKTYMYRMVLFLYMHINYNGVASSFRTGRMQYWSERMSISFKWSITVHYRMSNFSLPCMDGTVLVY